MRLAPPDVRYFEKSNNALAALACFFNPCGYQAPIRNLQIFRNRLAEQGVPLYILELAVGGRPFCLIAGENVLQMRAESILFHKERLLNLLLSRIPPQFNSLAWLDGDVIFEDENWALAAIGALEEYPVIQLFDCAEHLDRSGAVFERRVGIAAAVATGHSDSRNLSVVHPGFAWAARREWWNRHGLFELNVLGGGDSDIACSLFGWWEHPHFQNYHDAMKREVLNWGYGVWHDIRGRIGWIPGAVQHLWHGSLADRQYWERCRALARHNFDPTRDLQKNVNAPWEWTGVNRSLQQHVRDYFFARREDS